MNEVRIRASVDDKVSTPLAMMKKKFEAFGKTAGGTSSIGKGLGLGVGIASFNLLAGAATGAADAIVQGAFKSIDAASSLNEAVSKSRAVFKGSADDIESWADTAADSFGQSKRQALEAAGTFGNLIQAFGIGSDKAATMSKTLVELASDLASFNNTSVDDAILALRSGLSGETEPLKRYGVALNDVRLKEEALRMGLIKTTSGVLPITIKTQAAYALILKDTALAQGDFDRTSDGLANTQRSLSAAIEDVTGKIGTKLLPVALQLATWVKDEGVPAINDLVDTLEEAGPVLEGVARLIGVIVSQGQSASMWAAEDAKKAAKEAARAAERSADGIASAIKNRNAGYRRESEALAGKLPIALEEAKKEAKRIARQTPGEIADALRSRRSAWQSALDDLESDAENKLSRMAEIAKLKALLAGDEIANGLKSKDPVVRAAAAALMETATDRLNELQGRASHAGNAAARDLARALKNKKLDVRQAAELLELQVKNALGQLPSSAYGWGKSTSREYAEGLRANIPKVENAAKAVARSASDYLRIQSPAKKGPLSEGGPEVWGAKFGASWAKGLDGSKGAIERASSGLAGGVRRPAGGIGPLGLGGETMNGISLHFHGMAYPPSPAQQREMAQNMGPALREYLDRRG